MSQGTRLSPIEHYILYIVLVQNFHCVLHLRVKSGKEALVEIKLLIPRPFNSAFIIALW